MTKTPSFSEARRAWLAMAERRKLLGVAWGRPSFVIVGDDGDVIDVLPPDKHPRQPSTKHLRYRECNARRSGRVREANEYRAYRYTLCGKAPSEIAAKFGYSLLYVRQLIAAGRARCLHTSE